MYIVTSEKVAYTLSLFLSNQYYIPLFSYPEPLSIGINIPNSRVRESDGTVDVEILLSRPATEDIELNLILRSGSASGEMLL